MSRVFVYISFSLVLCVLGCEELLPPRDHPEDVDPNEFLDLSFSALSGVVFYNKRDTVSPSVAGTFLLTVKNLHDEVFSGEEAISIDIDFWLGSRPGRRGHVHGDRNNLTNPYNFQGHVFMLDGDILTIHPDSSANLLLQWGHTQERFWDEGNPVFMTDNGNPPSYWVQTDPLEIVAEGSIRLFAAQRIPLTTDQVRFTVFYFFRVDHFSLTRMEGLVGWADSDGTAILKWQTPYENNFVHGFQVQKSPSQSQPYRTIADSFVPAEGSFQDTTYYMFTQFLADPGVWYYRVAQLEHFGPLLGPVAVRFTPGIRVEVP